MKCGQPLPTSTCRLHKFQSPLIQCRTVLADIDASKIKDSNDAPNAAAYDRIRQLSPVALGNEFAKRWPAFADHLNGQAGNHRLLFELVNFTSEENINLNLPRVSTAMITAPMPAFEHSIRFGWDARLGDLVLRQMVDTSAGPAIESNSLYTGLLSGGSLLSLARLGLAQQQRRHQL